MANLLVNNSTYLQLGQNRGNDDGRGLRFCIDVGWTRPGESTMTAICVAATMDKSEMLEVRNKQGVMPTLYSVKLPLSLGSANERSPGMPSLRCQKKLNTAVGRPDLGRGWVGGREGGCRRGLQVAAA